MSFLLFVSFIMSANSVHRSYFVSGDIVGLQELTFFRKGIVCLLVKLLSSFRAWLHVLNLGMCFTTSVLTLLTVTRDCLSQLGC